MDSVFKREPEVTPQPTVPSEFSTDRIRELPLRPGDMLQMTGVAADGTGVWTSNVVRMTDDNPDDGVYSQLYDSMLALSDVYTLLMREFRENVPVEVANKLFQTITDGVRFLFDRNHIDQTQVQAFYDRLNRAQVLGATPRREVKGEKAPSPVRPQRRILKV